MIKARSYTRAIALSDFVALPNGAELSFEKLIMGGTAGSHRLRGTADSCKEHLPARAREHQTVGCKSRGDTRYGEA